MQGLTYIQNFIDEKEEENLLAHIYDEKWSNSLSRRVQHYGYPYNYRSQTINRENIVPIPKWLTNIVIKILKNKHMASAPTQIIINEYTPGQGIGAHIGASIFGEQILSLSLSSNIMMEFKKGGIPKYSQYLERRSLVILQGAARHKYSHEIIKRKSDSINGIKIPRDTRVSITFRYLKI